MPRRKISEYSGDIRSNHNNTKDVTTATFTQVNYDQVMPFDSSRIYKVNREFKAAKSLRKATRILEEHKSCFLIGTANLLTHWTALQDSGLMDTLLTHLSEPMALLSKPSETQVTPTPPDLLYSLLLMFLLLRVPSAFSFP